MSDDEILRLIAEAPSDEWTEEQIELVRSRLAESPTIRAAMTARLQLDDLLAATFDAESFNPQRVLDAAAQIRPLWRRPVRRRRWPWGVALLGLVVLAGAAWHWWPEDGLPALGNPFSGDAQVKHANAKGDDVGGEAQESGDGAGRGRNQEPGEETFAANLTESPPRATEPDETPIAPAIATTPPRVPVEPWEKADHLGGGSRPYTTVGFVDAGDGPFTPRSDELRRWLVGLPGIRLDIAERDIDGRRCGVFDGAAKLAAPWRADAMLRMSLRDANKLKLYFWRGDRGVMLQYHEDRGFAWAAYVVERDAGETKPKSYALAATDDERGFRTSRDGRGTFDLFCRAGELVLARGGIELLAAPLSGPPAEVLLDGRACFLGLAMARVSELPPAAEAFRPTTVENAPARLDWTATTPAGAKFELSATGSVALTATKSNAPAQAVASALPSNAALLPQEIVCRIEDATPGASLFIADDRGRQTEVLRFMRSQTTGGVGVWLVAAGDGRLDAYDNFDTGPLPLVGSTTWLRILSTPMGLRLWLSADGVHWASPWSIRGGVAARRLGISLWPGEEPRGIRVTQVAWRSLSGLLALAPSELIAAANVESPPNIRAWREAVRRTTPPDVDAANWRRAAAVAALSQTDNVDLARWLAAELAAETAGLALPLDVRIAALDDLARLANCFDAPPVAQAIMDAYAALAADADNAGEQAAGGAGPFRPYSEVVPAMFISPVRTREAVRFDAARLARAEVLQLVDAGDWDALDQLCRVLRFRDDADPRDERQRRRAGGESLVDWAQMLARRHVKGVEGEPRPAMHPSWREPLVAQFDTDAFNVLAEFQAAIEGEAYRDAAETIASAGGKLVEATDTLGVLPDASEAGLYVSLRVAVEQAMRVHPGLASAMQERIGPAASLRVRKAIAEGNESILEAATLQYHGTPAAAEAHLWLGNRSLSIGDFARAVAHFQAASNSGDAAIAAEARNRARLAGALGGRRIGDPPTSLVRIGDESIAAGEFERVVEQLVTRSANAMWDGDGAAESQALQRIAAAEFQAVKRGEFRYGPVAPPRPLANRDLPRGAVDWFARGTAIAARENLLVVSGRTSAAAFDTEQGARLWEAALQGPGDDASAWPVSSARPLFFGDSVLVRWFARGGATLICLDAKDGRQVWQAALAERQAIVGDPFLAQGNVFAFAAQTDALGQNSQLALLTLDKESGVVLRSRPLVRLGETWRDVGACRATLDRDRLYIALASVIVCADLSGQVHWVRALPHVPASVDPWSYVQAHDSPLVAGDRVFVAAPTVRKVVCLEAASGRMLWQRSEIDLVEVVSLAEQLLVVRNADGFIALEAANGAVKWRRAADAASEVLARPEEIGAILVAQRGEGEARRQTDGVPRLTWIDPATGESVGEWSNAEWKDRGGRFGPIAVSSQGRIWGLRGPNPRGEVRDVVELVPPGATIAMPTVDEPQSTPPANAVTAALQTAADKTLPGWTVAGGVADPGGALVKHLESDDTVLAIADASGPVSFTHQATIGAQSQGRLRIKTGYLANEAWQIRVAAGDRVLLEKTIGGKPEPGWERFELELASLAGQTVKFEVSAKSPDATPKRTLWKRLLVAP